MPNQPNDKKGNAALLPHFEALARSRIVAFTHKAFRELAKLDLDEEDACEILSGLTVDEFPGAQSPGMQASGGRVSNRRLWESHSR